MGNASFTQPPPPPPPPPVPSPTGINTYAVPTNSGSVDIDVGNLQSCMLQGGGSACINTYVQGYNTSNNTFVPTQFAPQGFEQLEENLQNNSNSNTILIIFVLLVLLITIKY